MICWHYLVSIPFKSKCKYISMCMPGWSLIETFFPLQVFFQSNLWYELHQNCFKFFCRWYETVMLRGERAKNWREVKKSIHCLRIPVPFSFPYNTRLKLLWSSVKYLLSSSVILYELYKVNWKILAYMYVSLKMLTEGNDSQ